MGQNRRDKIKNEIIAQVAASWAVGLSVMLMAILSPATDQATLTAKTSIILSALFLPMSFTNAAAMTLLYSDRPASLTAHAKHVLISQAFVILVSELHASLIPPGPAVALDLTLSLITAFLMLPVWATYIILKRKGD